MSFRRFNPLNVPEHWERYWTKYPQGMTILESLMEWVTQVDDMVNNVNDWNEYLDDFVKTFDKELEETVIKILGEWQDSGFLEEIINKAISTRLDIFELRVVTRSVNEEPRLAPEITDTGRIQRMIDKMDRGTLFFHGEYLVGDIVGKGNIEYIATKGTTITFTENAKGFYFDRQHNWAFKGFTFDGSLQLTSDSHMVNGYKCNDVNLEENILKDGAFGFALTDPKRSRMHKNFANGFRQWPLIVYGCDTFAFTSNISTNNAYDGLKCAGVETDAAANLHKNLLVAHNTCLFNQRDGFDMAGNNIQGAKIHDNFFNNNYVNGIDFKMVYQGLYMQDVEIYNNTCLMNTTHQMNLQINLAMATAKNIFVKSNTLECADILGGSAGLRLYGFKDNIVVKHNNIVKGQFGMRLLDTNNTYVEDNEILGSSIGVEVSVQVFPEMTENLIKRNVIKTVSTPVRITSAAVKGTVVDLNTLEAELDTFVISDLGTNTVYGANYGKPTDTLPVGRGTQGERRRNKTLGVNKPLEWVSLNTNGNAQWVPVGMIANKSEHTIAAFTVPPIPANGTVFVDYQQIPCKVGDILTAFPLGALPNNAASWNVFIAAENRIKFVFHNHTPTEVNISGVDWRIVLDKK